MFLIDNFFKLSSNFFFLRSIHQLPSRRFCLASRHDQYHHQLNNFNLVHGPIRRKNQIKARRVKMYREVSDFQIVIR